MNAIDVVYDGIYKSSLKQKASTRSAHKHAQMGCKMYKQSSFADKTVGKMIERMIKEATQESKAEMKNKKRH